MIISWKFVFSIHSLLYCVLYTSAAPHGDSIDISLINYKTNNQNTQIFESNASLNFQSILDVNIVDVPINEIDFFIIQVHSFKHSIILSSNVNFARDTYINGTNIGLVQTVSNNNKYEFFVKNTQDSINNTIYIAILPYKSAPIPGGCNLEFVTEIAPYQKLKYTNALITVDAQIASMFGHLCEDQIVKHERYQMYLPELDFSAETYFDGIRKMLTVESIETYGTQVMKPKISYLRQLYNAYRGTGAVFAVVASFNSSKSAYVPIVTYSCDIWTENCDNLNTTISKVLCGLLVFLGLFTCFFGHKFFKTEMFFAGSLVGAFIVFSILSALTNLTDRGLIICSLVAGLVFGLIWLGFWWYCGIPVLSTLLSLFIFGFLIAAIAFYAEIGDLTIVNNDLTYWGFFMSIVLLCMTILTGFMDKANILSTAVVGAYVFIIPLDHYYGTNLKYIFITIFRRMTVKGYNEAIIDPPFQEKDLLLTILWAGLAANGVVYQWRQQRGRPPFPSTSNRMVPDERTPLLIPTSADPSDRIILIHSSPSDA